MPPINFQHVHRPVDTSARLHIVEVRKAAARNGEPSVVARQSIKQRDKDSNVGAKRLTSELGSGVTSIRENGVNNAALNPVNVDATDSVEVETYDDLPPWDGSPESNATHFISQSKTKVGGTVSVGAAANSSVVGAHIDQTLVAIQPSMPPGTSVRTVQPLNPDEVYVREAFVLEGQAWGAPRGFETSVDFTATDFSEKSIEKLEKGIASFQLALPNIKDDDADTRIAALEGFISRNSDTEPWKNTTPVETLKQQRSEILRATLASQLIFPKASENIRHYFLGGGEAVQREVATDAFASETIANDYRNSLERQAIAYALKHPDVREFTVQGPLFNQDVMNDPNPMLSDKDSFMAFGNYWVGGVGHYKVVKREDSAVELDGATRMFMHDYYNFSSMGMDFPVLEVPRSHIFEMSLAKDPETGKPLAQNYEVFLVDKSIPSRIKSSSQRGSMQN
jgi:hypothetical protein